MEDRFIDLETKVAFQEKMIEELQEALHEHWDLIERLSQTVDEMQKKLAAVEPSQLIDRKDESPPPHY